MKKTYIIGNWKSNKTASEALSWVKKVNQSLPKIPSNIELVICLPFIHLGALHGILKPTKLGVQNLSPFPDGAYTGEISARMLEGLVSYVILGHSERRHYFSETSSQVALKVTQALQYGITPIIALSHKTWRQQLNQLDPNQKDQSIFMYEPPEAISQPIGPIGKGEAAPVKEVVAAIDQIKQSVPQSPVIYGGSVKSENLADYLSQPEIDGVLPGSASLNATEWLKIISIALKHRG